MRLNFSGVTGEEIAEGIKRIGAVIDEQVQLYEALAPGSSSPPAVAPTPPAQDESAETSNVFPLRKEAGR